MKASKTTIYRLVTIFFVFCLLTMANCRPFDKIMKNQNILTNKIRFLQESDYSSDGNNTQPNTEIEPGVYKASSSSGLSTGGIVGIAIPTIAALVGVGALAAFLGVPSGGAAAPGGFGPVLNNPVPNLPPPNYIDTSMSKLVMPTEVAPVQPVVEVPPQPVQHVVPVAQVEPPVVHNVVLPPQPQPIAQPQMVPVQQMQLVPVQQVQMVPVQHVEMVPVQEVVPTYQTAEVVPQVQEIGQIGEIGQVQGIEGAEFLTEPQGYGTSVIQGGANNAINPMEFSTNNII